MIEKVPFISLASQSPRRREILEKAGISFELIRHETEELVPDGLLPRQIAELLAVQKAENAFQLHPNKNVLAADTIVLLDAEVCGKPEDADEAELLLQKLSDTQHEVITGYSFRSAERSFDGHAITKVYFDKISESSIRKYISSTLPYDKAGGYGIQDWIGIRYVAKILGSYENVLGLPLSQILRHFEN